MYSPLDNYLKELETKLRSLPRGQRESDMAEIRQHLEAMAAAYKELDCTDDEAARCAIQQFGPSKPVARELLTVSRRADRHRIGTRLCYAGWCLFLLSLALPVFDLLGSTVRGYQCALIVFSPSFPMMSSDSWGLWYYHGLGLANILMLASPVMLALLKGKRQRWIAPLLMGISTAAITPLLPGASWQIGFYVWLASFALVAAGSFIQAQKRVHPRFAVG